MADRDDEVDAFDAMMGIDADEFATLLDDAEDSSDGGQDADDAPKLHRGGPGAGPAGRHPRRVSQALPRDEARSSAMRR